MPASQPDYEPAIQAFLQWEQSDSTLRRGTSAPTEYPSPNYVPQSALDAYFKDESSVKNIIFDLNLQDPPSPRYIWQHYRKIFAILLSIHRGSMIRQFVHHYIGDRCLPLTTRPQEFPTSSAGDLWKAFYQGQWKYCVKKMHCGMQGKLPKEEILPFVVEDQLGKGRSATLHKIVVDSEYNRLKHHSDHENQKGVFALKKYKSTDAEEFFMTEKRAFDILNESDRPPNNIIGYHGSFIHGGGFNLILEYADQGNLQEFMEEHGPPPTGEDIIVFWTALAEILNGLQTIHAAGEGGMSSSQFMCGWHQDIKPTNILVKKKPGAPIFDVDFVVADLGLSHFKPGHSIENDVVDEDTHGVSAWGAPETFRITQSVRNTPRKVSQTVDVFSLGCIFSEIATWIVYGQDRVEEYRSQRCQEVAQKIKNRGEDGYDGDLFHDSIDILDTVNDIHKSMSRGTAGVSVDDFMTPQIVRTVIPEMIEKDIMARSRAPQAYNQMIKAKHWAQESLMEFRQRPSPRPLIIDPTQCVFGPSGLGSSTPTRIGPSQELRPVPTVDIPTVLKLKAENKLPTLPDKKILDDISDRDNIFLMDNSTSMLRYRKESRDILLALAYLVKRHDPNGIDLLFTQSSRKVVNTKKSQKFMEEFDRVDFQGTTAMSNVLDKILRDYRLKITESRRFFGRVKLAIKPQASIRPLSLYILTDGDWQPDYKVAGPIGDMVDFMTEHKNELLRNQVAIQFIRFGENEAAMKHLDHLDDRMNLKLYGPLSDTDIVDHTGSDENVWKMILGAVLPWFDAQRPVRSPP